jgi:pyruvate dehydrogenase E1 component
LESSGRLFSFTETRPLPSFFIRGALRRHFKVDAESIVVAALSRLADAGEVKAKVVQQALDKYRLSDISAADPGNTEGSG